MFWYIRWDWGLGMPGRLIRQTWLIWKFLCMDYSSFVSVKSRHDCHEGMKDGNHSEGRSSDSFFPPENRQGAQDSYLDSFQSCLAVTSLGWFTVCSQFYPYIYFSSTIWDVPRKRPFWSRRPWWWWLILEMHHFRGRAGGTYEVLWYLIWSWSRNFKYFSLEENEYTWWNIVA